MATKWMSEFADVPLNMMLLPMTHDSATAGLTHYNISGESGYDIKNKLARFAFSNALQIQTIKNVVLKVATTQYPSSGRDGVNFLVDQAVAGVRAFDLRIFMGEQILYQHGTIVLRIKVLESFVSFAKYIYSQPRGEFYILRLSHFRGSDAGNMESYKHLADGIRDIFGQLLCTHRDWLRATIGQLASTPVKIIMDVPPNMSGIFSYAPWLQDSRACYDDDYETVKRMRVGLNSQDVIRYCIARINSASSSPPASKLIELQAHLQFVMPGGDSLFKNPQAVDLKYSTEKSYLNADVIRLLQENPWRGIVAFDFYSADLTPHIIAINKKNIFKSPALPAPLPSEVEADA
jgi:hypothetical protein